MKEIRSLHYLELLESADKAIRTEEAIVTWSSCQSILVQLFAQTGFFERRVSDNGRGIQSGSIHRWRTHRLVFQGPVNTLMQFRSIAEPYLKTVNYLLLWAKLLIGSVEAILIIFQVRLHSCLDPVEFSLLGNIHVSEARFVHSLKQLCRQLHQISFIDK